MPIIAVVSGAFCSGGRISKQVADRLGYKWKREAFIHEAARKFDATATKLARTMTGDRTLLNTLTREYEKGVAYLKATMAGMLAGDDIVRQGPAAYLIPSTVNHVLKVGITADDDYRIRQAMGCGFDAKEAEKSIRKNDEGLAAWVHQQWSLPPWDPSLFHINIRLPSISLDEAVELICSRVSSDALEKTHRSKEAVEDLQLTAQIHLALLERGCFHCEVKSAAGKVIIEMTKKPAPPGALGRTLDALRFENLEDAARQIYRDIKGVKALEVRPLRRHSSPNLRT
jgi:two-component system, OmpR family, response regulator CpxR